MKTTIPFIRKFFSTACPFSVCCRWYRGGIEHCNAQLKKFGILSGKNRARLIADSVHGRLESAVRVITCIIQLQTLHTPIRNLVDMLVPAEVEIIEAKADVLRAYREVVNGCAIGKPVDIREAGGTVRGPRIDEHDSEPSDEDINTAMIATDFEIGEEVLVWWWTLWWRAKIHFISARKNEVTVYWLWSKKTTSNYLPRLIQKL